MPSEWESGIEVFADTGVLFVALLVGFLGGFVKGVVGFAMPLILVSGLGSVIAPELVLAALFVPTLLTNLWQSLRQGPRAAIASARRFRMLLFVGAGVLIASAQLVPHLPDRVLFLILGTPVVFFTLTQLAGWRPSIDPANRVAEVLAGVLGGFFGGMAGIVGPPLVLYLTAIDTPKTEQVRVQGVVFGLAMFVYAGAHTVSGILRPDTLLFSTLVAIPGLLGMALGFFVHDRVDQGTFRKLTLIVLCIAGFNLLRRAFF